MIRALCLAVLFSLISGYATAAESPKVGDAAPGFELKDQNGDLHSLEDYRDQWVALYFYPKDDTPDCTAEACEFRDDIFKYQRLGAQIIGISLDDTESHRDFAEKYALPFPLLADTEGRTAAAFGVKFRFLGITVAKRHTFLIDPDGNVARHYPDVDPETHSAELLSDLSTLTGKSID